MRAARQPSPPAGGLPLDTALFSAGDRVLVGVSGGADSLSLLHSLAARRERLGIELFAVHVHHGMRADADADVRFLEQTCAAWGVPLAVERYDVPELARERRISVEEAGRDARYQAFRTAAARCECNKVATAHTADDQAETILLNLFRGTGVDGLAGIPPRRPLVPGVEVVRPLLGAWRREVDAYCAAQGLSPRFDSTNLDRRYRRSRLRYELLPRLLEFAPALKENLVRLARQAREEAEVLQPLAADLLRRAMLPPAPAPAGVPAWLLPPPTSIFLSAAVLSEAPPALARRALRRALQEAAGFEVEVTADLLERLLRLATEGGPPLDLPGAPLRASRDGDRLRLEREAEAAAPPGALGLPDAGELAAPEYGLRLSVRRGSRPADLRRPPEEALLNPAAFSGPLVLRTPRSGERFQPLGAPGRRLVSDLLTDRKIPAPLRRRWPVVADADGILWVVGVAAAERGRVYPEAEQCLWLHASPLRAGAAEEG